MQDEQLTKVHQDIGAVKMSVPPRVFGDVLGLGSSGAYAGSQNTHGVEVANLENKVNFLKNKVAHLEQGSDQNEEPKDGWVKFAGSSRTWMMQLPS